MIHVPGWPHPALNRAPPAQWLLAQHGAAEALPGGVVAAVMGRRSIVGWSGLHPGVGRPVRLGPGWHEVHEDGCGRLGLEKGGQSLPP